MDTGTNRADHLNSRNQHKDQSLTDPTSQNQQNHQDSESKAELQHSTQLFVFPNLDSVINSPCTPHSQSVQLTKGLDVNIMCRKVTLKQNSARNGTNTS